MRMSLFAASLIALALGACTPPAGDGGQQLAQAPAGAPASCETPAVPIALGASVSDQITAAAGYPENARYFCFQAPEGGASVTVTLSGMSTDLDLYVGSNTLASVQGVDISAGQNYEWKSNAFGTDAERIVIEAPRAGVYYAEIVSFQGEASPYTFSVQ